MIEVELNGVTKKVEKDLVSNWLKAGWKIKNNSTKGNKEINDDNKSKYFVAGE